MTHLVRCPEEDPVMVNLCDEAVLVLVIGKVQMTFADGSLQELGLGPG